MNPNPQGRQNGDDVLSSVSEMMHARPARRRDDDTSEIDDGMRRLRIMDNGLQSLAAIGADARLMHRFFDLFAACGM